MVLGIKKDEAEQTADLRDPRDSNAQKSNEKREEYPQV